MSHYDDESTCGFHQALRVAAENHSMRLLAGWNGVPLVGIGHSTIEGADPCLKAPKYPEIRCQVAGRYAQQDKFGIWVSDQDCKEKQREANRGLEV